MSERRLPLSISRLGPLILLILLSGCGQSVEDMITRTWCGFDGEAEEPFMRATGFRVDAGIVANGEVSEGALAETIAPEIRFVSTDINEIRFHRDGTMEVTERTGEQWSSQYEFVTAHEIIYLTPDEHQVREGVVVDGNTLALVRLDAADALEVRRFVRALAVIPC